jgi:hypothetical protein
MQNKLNNITKNPSIFRGVFCLYLFLISGLSLAQPSVKFEPQKKNFGFVKKGEVVKIEFPFTNNGNQPLLITAAKVECSCTTVDYPKQPILPNEKGMVIISFDTKTVYDRQDRIVVIVSNAKNNEQKIRFKGVVLK